MGYDVFITRRENFFDEGSDVTLEEWLSYVDSNTEMCLVDAAQATSPKGEIIRVEGNAIAIWTIPLSDSCRYFDYRNGNIAVKNPDTLTYQKMWAVAAALNAKVQGEEGEFYNENGDVIGNAVLLERRPWWKFW